MDAGLHVYPKQDSPSFAAEPLPRRSLAVPFVGKAPSDDI